MQEEINIYKAARWWLLLTAFVVGALGVLTFKVEGANVLSVAAIVVALMCVSFAVYMFIAIARYEGRSVSRSAKVIPVVGALLVGGLIGGGSSDPPEKAEAHTCTGTLIDHYICQQVHTANAMTWWYNSFQYDRCMATLDQHGYWQDFSPWWAPWTDIRWVQTRTEAYCWWNYSNYGRPFPHGPYLS